MVGLEERVNVSTELEGNDGCIPMLVELDALEVLEHLPVAVRVPKLLPRLQDAAWRIRKKTVETLGKLQPEDLVQVEGYLTGILQDPDWRVRRSAVQALGNMPLEDIRKVADSILTRCG